MNIADMAVSSYTPPMLIAEGHLEVCFLAKRNGGLDLLKTAVSVSDTGELFHTLRRVAGMFQMKNPPVRLLPFFILTENNDLATEYEYRHEGVNDYITAPVNIPELIRRVLFFVE